MKTHHILRAAAPILFLVSSSATLRAGDYPIEPSPDHAGKNPVATGEFDPDRVDAHAPIGVMGDHLHEAGEWMLSYRYMHMDMDGHRAGTDELTNHNVYHFGYGAAAQKMDMDMHMWGIMRAPTDWLTLTAMFHYVRMDMKLQSNPHAPVPAGGHGHGGGHGGTFGHSSEGLGDIAVGGLIKIHDRHRQRVHLNVGFVLPTAEIDHKQHGAFLPYGMQSGEGIWAFRPGITYTGQADRLSWGAQALGLLALEDENDSGFRFGDGVNLTTWVAHPIHDKVSLSGRLNYSYRDEIEGHYNGPHNHAAPPHFQENYGGHVLEAGVGINVLLGGGHRLAVEALFPIHQDANGVGMDRDLNFIAGWQFAF